MAEASKKNSELKKNTNLNDVERETAKKLISDEKNNKLKELMSLKRILRKIKLNMNMNTLTKKKNT